MTFPLDQKALYEAIRQELGERLVLLADKPEETLDSTLHALWLVVAGSASSAQLASDTVLPQLTAQQIDALKELIGRRLAGEPLSHLTGRQRFMGLEMLAGPAALVPRKETELLAQHAIDLAAKVAIGKAAPLVLDICTGSGNVATAVAHFVPTAQVFASDLSDIAVEFARLNAAHLALTSRVEFRVGDLMQPFDAPEYVGRLDVITCNPPYINSAKVGQLPQEISAYEPRMAFDGGSLGIAILMRLIKEAPRFLCAGGWLAFEVGLGQGAPMAKRVRLNTDFDEVVTVADADGHIRVVAARRSTL